jgi:hypothetical protein
MSESDVRRQLARCHALAVSAIEAMALVGQGPGPGLKPSSAQASEARAAIAAARQAVLAAGGPGPWGAPTSRPCPRVAATVLTGVASPG